MGRQVDQAMGMLECAGVALYEACNCVGIQCQTTTSEHQQPMSPKTWRLVQGAVVLLVACRGAVGKVYVQDVQLCGQLMCVKLKRFG